MDKRLCSHFFAAMLVFFLSTTMGCAYSGEPAASSGLTSAVLIADFACGSVEPNEKTHAYTSKQGITPEELAYALSRWTGLNFTVMISVKKNTLVVDWLADSTLLSNFDEREQKKEFHFFDAESMRWFMLDSLWRTLNGAFGKDVHYTMNGGKELVFEELSPINVFPASIPYMGSPFYFAHAGERGDME